MSAKILSLNPHTIPTNDWESALNWIDNRSDRLLIYKRLLDQLLQIEQNMNYNNELKEWFRLKNKIRVVRKRIK